METPRVELIEPPDGTRREGGLKVTCGPVGEIEEVKATVLENPPRLVKVTTTFRDAPGATDNVGELRPILKSGIA